MDLVVLTKQFGNYTGATISTIELLKRINSNFENITVLTLKSDGTVIRNVNVIVLSGYLNLINTLKKQRNVIGYSDDHLGFLFSFANIQYVHTYHGNWPDARKLNFNMFLKSFYFIPLYKLTVKKASFVVSASKYMQKKFVDPINSNNKVIYNGIKQETDLKRKVKNQNNRNKFLMVGNIDKRKYGKSLNVFDELERMSFVGTIDIYGALYDKSLVSSLNKYNFVNIKGVSNEIKYGDYTALICTSASENLPVSIVEAIINSVPVISSDVGGIPEVVINNETGYLLNVNHAQDFAKVIFDFQNLTLNTKYVDKITSTFNWNNASKLYKKVFERLGENINEDNYSGTGTR